MLAAMRFFEKKLSMIILVFSIPLLFLPKLNLMSVGDSETAGIRIDDIVLFIFATLLGWAHFVLHKRISRLEGWILVLIGLGLISFLLNQLFVSMDLLHNRAKILYALRLFEYFLFFYIGVMAIQIFPNHRIIQAFFLWNFFLMTLQKLQLVGGITVDGYYNNVSSRVHGIASFPSEMGLLLNLMFCYLIYDESIKSRLLQLFNPQIRHIFRKLYLYWIVCLFGLFVVFTGNRISILALLICFLFKLKSEINLRSIGSILALVVLIGVLGGSLVQLIYITESIYERSAGLINWSNVTLVGNVWERIDLNEDPIGNEVIPLANYDTSWWLRIHKWMFALKTYLVNPECYLQGIGPGFAWAALDGGFLRILTEYGIIGCFVFAKIFECLYRLNQQLKWMMIAFFINLIFFDAYLAYKTMSLLFFVAGHVYGKKLQEERLQQLEPQACA